MPEYGGERANSESKTVRPSFHQTPLGWLVYQFERVPVWTRAAIWGCIVFIVTGALDAAFFRFLFGITRVQLDAILFADFTSAVLIGFIVFSVLRERDEILKKRSRESGYLNHHIRNALMIIENAEYFFKRATTTAKRGARRNHQNP
jgi:hypothetical protein